MKQLLGHLWLPSGQWNQNILWVLLLLYLILPRCLLRPLVRQALQLRGPSFREGLWIQSDLFATLLWVQV